MTEAFYDNLASDYDRIIRWESRLAAEKPWFEALWRRYGVTSVLDAACGTGRHLSMFLDGGLDAVGSDASAEMVARAGEALREAGHDPDGRLFVCPWSELERTVPRTFDAVLCIGNSLPYVVDMDECHVSLRAMWSRMNPGGVVVVQFKNFEKLCARKERFLPLQVTQDPVETLAVRLYDYHPGQIDFNVLLLERQPDGWKLRHRVTPLRPYHAEDIVAFFRAVGGEAEVFGSLALTPYDRLESDDVVVIGHH